MNLLYGLQMLCETYLGKGFGEGIHLQRLAALVFLTKHDLASVVQVGEWVFQAIPNTI